MSEYFARSQRIKEEILRDEGLLQRTRMVFNGESEPFNSGSSVALYRIGRTESGLYFALRKFLPKYLEGNKLNQRFQQDKVMETYAQNAEYLAENGMDTLAFCIGVVKDQHVALLTEDLTQEGKFSIDTAPGDIMGRLYDERNNDAGLEDKVFHLNGNSLFSHLREIHVDLDNASFAKWTELKYFAPEHVIKL